MEKRNVLFVCLGNICRSPTAEGVLVQLVEERDLGARIGVESAGTIGYHAGSLPDPRSRSAASARGYELTSRSRPFEIHDFDLFDLIVVMDEQNRLDVMSQARDDSDRSRVRLLSAFLPEGSPRDVPDPYTLGPDGFEVVIDMAEAASNRVLQHLLELD